MSRSDSSVRVVLSPPLRRFLKQLVESGRYDTASQAIQESLLLLATHEASASGAIEEVRRRILEGEAQAKRGEFVSGEAAFAETRRRRAAHVAGRRRRA